MSPSSLLGTRRGFTMLEIIVVIAIVGVIVGVAIPKLRISPAMDVQLAAMQLAQDVDFARTRALSTRSQVRVLFAQASPARYTAYLDDDMNGSIANTVAERIAMRGFGERPLPARVTYGRGAAPPAPGDEGSGAVTFAASRAEFDSRGLVMPMGTSGTVYLRHTDKAEEVAAVAVSAAGNVRLWIYHDGAWK